MKPPYDFVTRAAMYERYTVQALYGALADVRRTLLVCPEEDRGFYCDDASTIREEIRKRGLHPPN